MERRTAAETKPCKLFSPSINARRAPIMRQAPPPRCSTLLTAVLLVTITARLTAQALKARSFHRHRIMVQEAAGRRSNITRAGRATTHAISLSTSPDSRTARARQPHNSRPTGDRSRPYGIDERWSQGTLGDDYESSGFRRDLANEIARASLNCAAPSPSANAVLVTAQLHGCTRAHWWRSSAPH